MAEASNILDGDLIEQFLELGPVEMERVRRVYACVRVSIEALSVGRSLPIIGEGGDEAETCPNLSVNGSSPPWDVILSVSQVADGVLATVEELTKRIEDLARLH